MVEVDVDPVDFHAFWQHEAKRAQLKMEAVKVKDG
jgi:hypothetical protein